MGSTEASQECSNIFQLRESEAVGRYTVAARTIQPGELIVNELPLMVGPPLLSSYTCFGCHKKIELLEVQHRCFGCCGPLCSPNCEGIGGEMGHSKAECKLLSEKKIIDWVEQENGARLKNFNEILFVLRCLNFKHSHPESWEKLLTLESHIDVRKDIPLHWYRNQFQIVNRIREDWNITEYTEDEIHTVCGIIKVNCFGIGRQGIKGRALYATTSMICHDCSPNARVIVFTDDFTMVVRASREIQEEEQITISYLDMFMNTLQRREELKKSKFFWCVCRRCSDPTESGTNCSALRCPTCSTSSVLSTNPLDQAAPWRCFQCHHTINANVVSSILTLVHEELDETIGSNVPVIQKFITRYSSILGENHYDILSAKYAICQASQSGIANVDDGGTVDFLKMREQYCRDLLKLIDAIVPGQTRVKGILMFELYMTIMILTGKKAQNKEITKGAFRKGMGEAITLLQQSEEILQWEPIGSVGQKMAQQAMSILLQLKCNTKDLSFNK